MRRSRKGWSSRNLGSYNQGVKRVTGSGGVFFKAEDREKLYAWYEKHLGLKGDPSGGVCRCRGRSGWDDGVAIFKKDTKYFNPSQSNFMIDFRVDDLDALRAALKEEGVEIDPKREDVDYGRCGSRLRGA